MFPSGVCGDFVIPFENYMGFWRQLNHTNLYKRDRLNFQAMYIGKLRKMMSFFSIYDISKIVQKICLNINLITHVMKVISSYLNVIVVHTDIFYLFDEGFKFCKFSLSACF